MASTELSAADRIINVLDELGIQRAHIVGCLSSDWGDLIGRFQERLSSLTIVAPHLNQGVPASAETNSIPSLIIAGDQGAPAERARSLSKKVRSARLHSLAGYESPIWADTASDRTMDVEEALRDFWNELEPTDDSSPFVPAKSAGEVAGVHYRIEGSGPPVVLLPLSLSSSQWTSLIKRLKDDYCTIVLGGAYLGAISLLEGRAQSGYGDLLVELVNQATSSKSERILEVGCGSGALVRKIVQQTNQQNPIVGTDLSPYLLSEARLIAAGEELDQVISFEQANAEDLPYADESFDISISSTVMEEGDANKMIAELARVTNPGGRIIAVVRATDVDWWVNIPLSPDRQKEVNALGPKVGAGVGPGGCADASLYQRIIAARLQPNLMGPRFAVYRDGDRMSDVLDRLGAALPADATSDFQKARDEAQEAGTICMGEPFHCAVITR
ncbi:MAG: methyltransferase domain-containing protein [Hyphomicrobiaceae bacterium]